VDSELREDVRAVGARGDVEAPGRGLRAALGVDALDFGEDDASGRAVAFGHERAPLGHDLLALAVEGGQRVTVPLHGGRARVLLGVPRAPRRK
jgi:hypothetical protein